MLNKILKSVCPLYEMIDWDLICVLPFRFKGELPEGRHMKVQNKNFYFDIGQNNRGIYMRISEVSVVSTWCVSLFLFQLVFFCSLSTSVAAPLLHAPVRLLRKCELFFELYSPFLRMCSIQTVLLLLGLGAFFPPFYSILFLNENNHT